MGKHCYCNKCTSKQKIYTSKQAPNCDTTFLVSTNKGIIGLIENNQIITFYRTDNFDISTIADYDLKLSTPTQDTVTFGPSGQEVSTFSKNPTQYGGPLTYNEDMRTITNKNGQNPIGIALYSYYNPNNVSNTNIRTFIDKVNCIKKLPSITGAIGLQGTALQGGIKIQ